MRMKSSSGGIRQRSFEKVSASSVFGEAREKDCDPFTEQWEAEIGTSDCLGYLSWANPTLFLPVHFVS